MQSNFSKYFIMSASCNLLHLVPWLLFSRPLTFHALIEIFCLIEKLSIKLIIYRTEQSGKNYSQKYKSLTKVIIARCQNEL